MPFIKRFSFLVLALVCVCPLHSFSITGSESYVQNMNNLPTFKKVYISAGSIEVNLHQDNKSSIRLEGDKEAIEALDVKVVQGELEITYKKGNGRSSKKGTIKVDITTRNLSAISTKGSVSIKSEKSWKVNSLNFLLTGSGEVEMTLNANNLVVQLSGSTELNLSGNADYQNIAVTGSGKYEGSDLKTNYSTVVLSGSGSASVFAKKTLDVTIYGSGDVHYKGTPKITSNIFGSGNVVKSSLL